jgi:hypothetical protein
MLILPISGAVMLLGMVIVAVTSGGGPPSALRVVALWLIVDTFIATYWTLLWRGLVRWNRSRIVLTVAAGAGALACGAAVSVVVLALARGIPAGIACLFGGGVVPILWVTATVLIWRETPHERVERLNRLASGAVCCSDLRLQHDSVYPRPNVPECGARFTHSIQLFTTQPAPTSAPACNRTEAARAEVSNHKPRHQARRRQACTTHKRRSPTIHVPGSNKSSDRPTRAVVLMFLTNTRAARFLYARLRFPVQSSQRWQHGLMFEGT